MMVKKSVCERKLSKFSKEILEENIFSQKMQSQNIFVRNYFVKIWLEKCWAKVNVIQKKSGKVNPGG